MAVGTDMSHDARVWKEALTLAHAGYSVTVLAAYHADLPAEEVHEGVRVIRVEPRRLNPFPRLARAKGGLTQQLAAAEQPVSHTTSNTTHSARADGLLASLTGSLWSIRVLLENLCWVKRLAPDVLHVHDADRLALGLLASALCKVRIVYDAHEYVPGLDKQHLARFTLQRYCALERALVQRSQAVITVNAAIADLVRDRHNLSRVTVLHNFPHACAPEGDGHLLRTRLPDELRQLPVFLFQGRLTSGRGIEEFLHTVSLLPDVAGVVVGSGPQENAFQATAEQLGISRRVVFIPQVPWRELSILTQGADLGFCLSQATCQNNILALPNKLFEYLTAGVPVVVSDFPVLRQYVVEQEVGIAVPQDEPREIARRVRALLDEHGRIEQMRRNAREVSRTKYNWTSQEPALVALYDELDRRKPSSPCSEPYGVSQYNHPGVQC
jgi:glycosyltransferase involved in cell wall biosynthesis